MCSLSLRRRKGLIRIFAGTVKQTAKQGGSPFLLLSDISFEAWEKDGGYTLSEYECRNSRAMLDLEWQTYVYSQIFTDIALALLPEAEADMRVFALCGLIVPASIPKMYVRPPLLPAGSSSGWPDSFPIRKTYMCIGTAVMPTVCADGTSVRRAGKDGCRKGSAPF